MTDGPDDVAERIRAEIRSSGPVRFDRFMELSLYGDGGYFDRPPVGIGGDFLTSPHVHPWFAYGIARAFAELHEGLGAPRTASIVEVGAGDGTLARQLLEILGRGAPLRYVAIERGSGAREALGALDVEIHETIDDIATLDDAVVIGNELLDNLPFRRVRWNGSAPVEVHIDLVGDRLVEVERPVSDLAVSDLAAPDIMAPDVKPPGENAPERVVPTGALGFVDALASRMRRSYALLIDYSTERGQDVHGYRRHRVVADLLDRPGEVDVTAGVDLDAVEARARDNGLVVLGRVTQRAALLALGFDEWIAADRERRAGSGAGVEARAWAARNRASLLVARDGLGAHRWVLVATPKLPAPRWLVAATESRSPD